VSRRYVCGRPKRNGSQGERTARMAAYGIEMPRCEGRPAFTTLRKPVVMEISTIGLDLAKSVFQVHGADPEGNVVVRRTPRRAQVLPFFAKLPPCLVGMNASTTVSARSHPPSNSASDTKSIAHISPRQAARNCAARYTVRRLNVRDQLAPSSRRQSIFTEDSAEYACPG
jgi:hypothetical protein